MALINLTATSGGTVPKTPVPAPVPSPAPVPAPVPTTTYSTLKTGSTGTPVTTLQQKLAALGYYTGKVDGIYGNMTQAAVTAYQKATGLAVDGIAGTQTQTALYSPKSSATGAIAGSVMGAIAQPVPATTAPAPAIVRSPVPAPTPTSATGTFVAKPEIVKPQLAEQRGVTDTSTGGMVRPITQPPQPVPSGVAPAVGAATGVLASLPAMATKTSETNDIKVPDKNTGSTVLPTGTTGTTPSVTPTPTNPSGLPVTSETSAQDKSTLAVINAPKAMDNPYWQELTQSKFEYDPSTDRDYWKAAANAEYAIIQSMIGRGGLYSSIARDSVAVKMIDLAIEYESLAYEKYVEDRNFKFQLAQFEQERLNDAWSQAFQTSQAEYDKTVDAFNQQMELFQYKADLENEAWNRKMDSAAASRANQALALQKQQVKAAEVAASLQNQVVNALAAHNNERTAFELMVDRWENLGYADKQVAEFFSDYGVKEKDYVYKKGWQNLITTMENNYETEAVELTRQAGEVGYAAYASDYLSSYMREDAVVTPSGTTAESSTPNMKTNYFSYRASSLTTDGKAASESHIATKMEDLSQNKSKYESLMGTYYYDLLYEELAGKLDKITMSTYSG